MWRLGINDRGDGVGDGVGLAQTAIGVTMLIETVGNRQNLE